MPRPTTGLLRTSALSLPPLLMLALLTPLAYAQTQPPQGKIYATMQDSAPNESLKGNTTMVSVIHNGEVVQQTELRWNEGHSFYLPVGVYDIRFECEGAGTLVKRGVHATHGADTTVWGKPIRAGQGVRTVEYATGGLSREEIAARLNELSAKVAALTEQVGKLEKK